MTNTLIQKIHYKHPWNLTHIVSASMRPSSVALTRCAPPVVPKTEGSKVLWNTLNTLAEARDATRERMMMMRGILSISKCSNRLVGLPGYPTPNLEWNITGSIKQWAATCGVSDNLGCIVGALHNQATRTGALLREGRERSEVRPLGC